MSSEARPIDPARFLEALKDLPLSSLHLKVLELRNSIAHLDYSNQQLKPFADGTEAVLGTSAAAQPDQDCIDAIHENETVMARMSERIALIRTEVENRGHSWSEFQSKEEAEEAAAAGRARAAAEREAGGMNGDHEGVNGNSEADATTGTGNPWTDGTFQTGTISNGQLRMDRPGGGVTGGTLSDEELARLLAARMAEQQDEDGDEEGMHL